MSGVIPVRTRSFYGASDSIVKVEEGESPIDVMLEIELGSLDRQAIRSSHAHRHVMLLDCTKTETNS